MSAPGSHPPVPGMPGSPQGVKLPKDAPIDLVWTLTDGRVLACHSAGAGFTWWTCNGLVITPDHADDLLTPYYESKIGPPIADGPALIQEAADAQPTADYLACALSRWHKVKQMKWHDYPTALEHLAAALRSAADVPKLLAIIAALESQATAELKRQTAEATDAYDNLLGEPPQ